MIHKGVRPVYPVTLDTSDVKRVRKIYFEDLPDGGRRLWNERLLKSGCDLDIGDVDINGDLIYCPYCNEWANKNQFQEK